MEAGRFPAAMTTTRWFNHIHFNAPERAPRACWPRVWRGGFVLVVIRIVATSTLSVSVNRLWLMCLCLVSAH